MLWRKSSMPMTHAELQAWETNRDLEAELIESVRQMAEGKTLLAYPPVIAVRKASGFFQAQFAGLLGTSLGTLQGWAQGRRQPTGAAKTLIVIGQRNPEVLAALAGDERLSLAGSAT